MTETPVPNRDSLLALKAWAREEDNKRLAGKPSEWDQSHYFNTTGGSWAPGVKDFPTCGMACCIAGKTGLLAGYQPVFKGNESFSMTVKIDGEDRDVDEFAREYLGLTWGQANVLFDADNKISDIEKIIDRILDGDQFEDGCYPGEDED